MSPSRNFPTTFAGIFLPRPSANIFATWFTYDVSGKAWWLSMTANKMADGSYAGTLYQTNGPAFNARHNEIAIETLELALAVAYEPWPGTEPAPTIAPEVIAYHQPEHAVSREYAALGTLLAPFAPPGRFEFRIGDVIASIVDGEAQSGSIEDPLPRQAGSSGHRVRGPFFFDGAAGAGREAGGIDPACRPGWEII